MRMRKKKWALPFLEENSEIVLSEPENFKGKWAHKLNKSNIHLEIGIGKGDYINQMALNNTEIGWIGVEKDPNVACIAVKKYLENNHGNELFIVNDADNILNWFDNEEIDVIHLNFSDPWPKKGHTKRRLSSKQFLDKYTKVLKSHGQIIMKTDNSKLFNFSLVEILKEDYLLKDVWVDFRNEVHDEDAISEYEQKFMSLNQPIYRAIFEKKM